MGVLTILMLMSSLLVFGPGLVAGALAWRKGYRPWFWLLSMGPIGTLLMLLKPNLNRATTPEAREQWEERADWSGGILSGLTFFFIFAVTFFLGIAFFTLRTTAVPIRLPATMMPTPTAPTIMEPNESLDTLPPLNGSDVISEEAADVLAPVNQATQAAPN